MNKSLLEMFAKSNFTILPTHFIYAKVTTAPTLGKHFMISQDADEITVITAEENLGELDIIEKNEYHWRLVALNLAVPFTAGTIAAINAACAELGLNNLIVSTYSKDYIFVKDEHLTDIKNVLNTLGFKETGSNKVA